MRCLDLELVLELEVVRQGTLAPGLNFRWSLVISLLIALALVTAGCVLIYLGAVGYSEITLFGAGLRTADVGVVGIFCGAVIGIVNIRRTLKSLEYLAALPDV